MFCAVSHLLANKTRFLPHIVTKLRVSFLVLQLTTNDSLFINNKRALLTEFWCEITIEEKRSM